MKILRNNRSHIFGIGCAKIIDVKTKGSKNGEGVGVV